MSTKLKIDLSNGILEVEGDDALVERIYTDFKSVLATARQKQSRNTNNGKTPPLDDSGPTPLSTFGTLADCFAAFGEQTFTEFNKALVAAAYIQEKESLEAFTAQKINAELKHMGQGVSNITDALQANIDSKPQYIIQLKKAGNSKQARKTYKVTTEGYKKVGRMLRGEAEQSAAA